MLCQTEKNRQQVTTRHGAGHLIFLADINTDSNCTQSNSSCRQTERRAPGISAPQGLRCIKSNGKSKQADCRAAGTTVAREFPPKDLAVVQADGLAPKSKFRSLNNCRIRCRHRRPQISGNSNPFQSPWIFRGRGAFSPLDPPEMARRSPRPCSPLALTYHYF